MGLGWGWRGRGWRGWGGEGWAGEDGDGEDESPGKVSQLGPMGEVQEQVGEVGAPLDMIQFRCMGSTVEQDSRVFHTVDSRIQYSIVQLLE